MFLIDNRSQQYLMSQVFLCIFQTLISNSLQLILFHVYHLLNICQFSVVSHFFYLKDPV